MPPEDALWKTPLIQIIALMRQKQYHDETGVMTLQDKETIRRLERKL